MSQAFMSIHLSLEQFWLSPWQVLGICIAFFGLYSVIIWSPPVSSISQYQFLALKTCTLAQYNGAYKSDQVSMFKVIIKIWLVGSTSKIS